MEGEIVVVFYWLEGDFLTEEAQVVDRDGDREKVIEGWYGVSKRGWGRS